MEPFFIVGHELLLGDGPDILQVFKEVGIENFRSIDFVEPSDKGVLRWLAQLNMIPPNSISLTPVEQILLSLIHI